MINISEPLIFNEPIIFTINFPAQILAQAERFRQQQQSPQKAQQVYLNTLAVYAVHFYCDCIGIEASLPKSDSWNPIMQTLLNIADLAISHGRLECRPILPNTDICEVPAEVRENRLGYVIVEIDIENREASLIGFSKTANDGFLNRTNLQSLDNLIDELIEFGPASQSTTYTSTNAIILPEALRVLLHSADQIPVKLNDWLDGTFDSLWQEPTLAFTSNARSLRSQPTGQESIDQDTTGISIETRAKRISVDDNSLVLIVQIEPLPEAKLSILLKVYPGDERILPPGLQLALIDGEGKVVITITSAINDNFISIPFEIATQEAFGVRASIGQASIIEIFSS